MADNEYPLHAQRVPYSIMNLPKRLRHFIKLCGQMPELLLKSCLLHFHVIKLILLANVINGKKCRIHGNGEEKFANKFHTLCAYLLCRMMNH